MSTSLSARRRRLGLAGAILAAGALALPAGALANVDVSPTAHAEGDSGQQTFTNRVQLSCKDDHQVLPATATCDYKLAFNTNSNLPNMATPGEDYVAASPVTVTLKAGQTTTVPMTVDVLGDTKVEQDEVYLLGYSEAINGAPLNSTGAGNGVAGTIVNDDKDAPANPGNGNGGNNNPGNGGNNNPGNGGNHPGNGGNNNPGNGGNHPGNGNNSQPSNPSQPTNPTNPTNPSQPSQPTQPSNPGSSGNGGNGSAAPSQSTSTSPSTTNVTVNVPNGQNGNSPTVTQGGGHHTAANDATDEVGPRMGMVFRGLDRTLKVRVRCPRDEKSCTGRLAVRLNGTTLASKRFDLDGGESRTLSIALSRSQRRQLRQAGVVYLKATATDAAGNRLVRELSFQL